MSTEMKVRLGHPVVIFIHSLGLLLAGCAVGMHFRTRSAIWIAVLAAVLIVINEMISGFFWVSITTLWIHKIRRAGGRNGDV